jgi:hypothetical protein
MFYVEGAYGGSRIPATLGRAYARQSIATFKPSAKRGAKHSRQARFHLDDAIDGMHCVGTADYLLHALFARAAFRHSQGDFRTGNIDLAEAYDIVNRNEMRLHLTDYYLESARLRLAQLTATGDTIFRTQAETYYAEAADLIKATGYNRRLPELAAIRACLDGQIPAHTLAPNRDTEGRPIWHDLAIPPDAQ